MNKLLGAVVASLVLAAGINGGAATAATTFRDDPDDAGRNIDMNRVTLSRTSGDGMLVKTNFSDFGKRLNAVQYFFDVKRSDAGPEYGALIYRGKDGDGIKRVEVYPMTSFTQRGQGLINCRWRYRWYYNGDGPGYFNAKFPLGCFQGKGAQAIRVHVKTWNFTRYKGTTPHRRGVYGAFDNMGVAKAWTHSV